MNDFGSYHRTLTWAELSMVKMWTKALCTGERRPNSHVTPRRGIITTHVSMPIPGVKRKHSFIFLSFLDILRPYWLRNEEVRRIEPHRRTWLPLPLFCFSFMLWILPYLLKMVVFPSWLQQIDHLLYDSYEYQGVELKNTIGINWLFRYGYRIAKAREDPCQRRY